MSNVYDWCEEVYNNSRNGSWDESENIDLITAIHDLDNFRTDGWDVPEDLTPESYMDMMNSINAEHRRWAQA